MFMLIVSSSSSLSDPLRTIFMFANKLLNLAVASLICSSTLHLNLLYVVPYMHARYYFFVLFITPEASLLSLKSAVL